ncbi:MmgE/PrpD family protein [Chloroflexota bacterium]
MGVTRELSEWIVKASYRDFPEDAVSAAKVLLLKTIVGMVVGSREPLGRKVIIYLSGVGGVPEAGVVGGGFRTSVENAAFAHGTFAHASELEDDSVPDTIGDYWIFPAIFSLGEKLVSSGREIVEAAIVSWEAGQKMCRAAHGEISGLSCTWFGVVATAVAAAKLLKLNVDETTNALSIAASHSCGLLAQTGFDAHFIESGHTCRAGVQSAILAQAGMTGVPDVLERRDGLYAEVWFRKNNVDFNAITDWIGKPPYDVGNVMIKKFPCCLVLHAAIDALMMLVQENDIKYEDVERVDAEVPEWGRYFCDRPVPNNLGDARFSYYHVLGEILLRGKVDLSTFTNEENLFDPRHREAQGKIRVIVPADWPKEVYEGARVTVVKKDGQKLVKHLDASIGSAKYPLTLEQVRDVSRPYLDAFLEERHRDRVEEIVLNLEKQVDILELMDMLTFFRTPSRA